jgi:uncharacterized membrane protein
MQFVYTALTWGFLLALVPLLIHLINMMRHRRVQWAAMEFLQQSYKKHRKWVWLKQLLLLLARMAVIAMIVAMLAHPKTREQWLAMFGQQTTHHFVLLDDSYSMSDRVAGASALDTARNVVRSIANRAAQEDNPQKLTLLRFSRARGMAEQVASGTGQAAANVADFNAEPIDSQFDLLLEQKQRAFEPTQLAVGPRDALTLLKQLVGQSRDDTNVVYLVSDFREKDWASPADLKQSLQSIRESQAEVHLVNCARSQDPNLGLIDIAPLDDTRAAGVPLFVQAKVKNYGDRAATKVQLKLQSTFFPPEDLTKIEPDKLQGTDEELATLLIDSIGPGETVTRRVQVYFPQPGKHVVQGTLAEDPIEADNKRWCVIDLPEGERTLIIDGSDEQQHAYYLEAAFRPLEKSNTGVRPDVQTKAILRDVTAETLASYSSIYLLDVDRIEPKGVESLEQYVRGGGGLAIFSGPNTNIDFYNRNLYRDGEGLLPAPLGAEVELPPAVDDNTPDVELLRHPIFSFFLEETNPLIRGVSVDRYRAVATGWKPAAQSTVEVLARLRDRSPLVLEKKLGDGQVVLFLSTLAPEWNDWAKNPSFVVVALKTQAYLASTRRLDDLRIVGQPLDLQLEATKYRNDLAFIAAGDKPSTRTKIERQAAATENESGTLATSIGRSIPDTDEPRETDFSGIYEAWPITTKGEIDLRRWAFNVQPEEGDLARVSAADLLAKLDPLKVSYHEAEQFEQDESGTSGYNLSHIVMGMLVCLLVGEQALAYSASYHPAKGGAR